MLMQDVRISNPFQSKSSGGRKRGETGDGNKNSGVFVVFTGNPQELYSTHSTLLRAVVALLENVMSSAERCAFCFFDRVDDSNKGTYVCVCCPLPPSLPPWVYASERRKREKRLSVLSIFLTWPGPASRFVNAWKYSRSVRSASGSTVSSLTEEAPEHPVLVHAQCSRACRSLCLKRKGIIFVCVADIPAADQLGRPFWSRAFRCSATRCPSSRNQRKQVQCFKRGKCQGLVDKFGGSFNTRPFSPFGLTACPCPCAPPRTRTPTPPNLSTPPCISCNAQIVKSSGYSWPA